MPTSTRTATLPERSFLLLGPRSPGSWVVVVEVQRHPALLRDVHELLTRSTGVRFALTGSSARKLRAADVDLLAGRALVRSFYPLTHTETGPRQLDDALQFGGLPLVCSETDPSVRAELLDAWVTTYLAQEIRAEALVRSLDGFTRFLEVAALANAQVTNVAGIARDAGIARPTVTGWFEILVDALVASWLPAWRPRARIKEVAHPKFYVFDPGVARAMARRTGTPLHETERGALLETLVLHELRASGIGGGRCRWLGHRCVLCVVATPGG